MKVLGRLCNCWLCAKSSNSDKKVGFWYPCGCQIEDSDTNFIGGVRHTVGAARHVIQGVQVDGEIYPIDRVVNTGGRYALWIYLDNDEVATMLPAKQVGQEITDWNGKPVEIVARFPASVHGCVKVVKHQELVVLSNKDLVKKHNITM